MAQVHIGDRVFQHVLQQAELYVAAKANQERLKRIEDAAAEIDAAKAKLAKNADAIDVEFKMTENFQISVDADLDVFTRGT